MSFSIWCLLDLRKECRKKLKEAVDCMNMPCVFYYVRMIEILNVLICKKWYK